MDRTDEDRAEVDWMTAWHAAKVDSPAKHAICQRCGAPTPPLTEEELAEMWERSDWGMGSVGVRRLIADLRAGRAEVADAQRLSDQAQAAMRRMDRVLTDHVEAGRKRAAENAELRAEVEWLRAELADRDAWQAQFEEAVTAYKAACALDRFAAIPTINAINALVNAYDDLNQRD